MGWDNDTSAPMGQTGSTGRTFTPPGKTGGGVSGAAGPVGPDIPKGTVWGVPTTYNGVPGIWTYDPKKGVGSQRFVTDKDLQPPVPVPVPGYPGVTVQPQTADDIIKQRVAKQWEDDRALIAKYDADLVPYQKQRAALDTAESLFERGLKTGKVEDWLRPFRQSAKDVPFLSGLVDNDQLNMQTVFNAITKAMAQQMHVPGTGAQSERDMQYLLESAPSPDKPEEANRILLARLRQQHDWHESIQKARKAWLRKNGNLDDFTVEGTDLESMFPRKLSAEQFGALPKAEQDKKLQQMKNLKPGSTYIDENGEYQTKW